MRGVPVTAELGFEIGMNQFKVPPTVDIVVEKWNAKGLTKCVAISDQRKSRIKARQRSRFWCENWVQALDIIAESDFCKGVNDRGWKAHIDWFISSDRVVINAMEGKYGKPKAPTRKMAIEDTPGNPHYDYKRGLISKKEYQERISK